jgi:hypothetical protein
MKLHKVHYNKPIIQSMKKLLLFPALLIAGYLSAQTSMATWQDVNTAAVGTHVNYGV